MTNQRRPPTGSDAASVGALLLGVNGIFAGVGAGSRALAGTLVPLLLVGFFIGFFVGSAVVARRFGNLF